MTSIFTEVNRRQCVQNVIVAQNIMRHCQLNDASSGYPELLRQTSSGRQCALGDDP